MDEKNGETAKLVDTRENWEKACRNARNGENGEFVEKREMEKTLSL